MENLLAGCLGNPCSPKPGYGVKPKSAIWTEAEHKMSNDENKHSILTHGLLHVVHLSCKDSVFHMTCGDGAAGFASLHCSGHVQFYYPDGHLRGASICPSLSIQYAGLTSTHIPGRLVGWGPGAVLTLLDKELKPLIHAEEPMDVRVCTVLEQSNQLVSGGMGNICVWCLTHMVCRKRVVVGLGTNIVITQLALVQSKAQLGPRVLAAYGRSVVVVDLAEGCIIEHKKSLHLREITGLVYSPHTDCVVTASHTTIRVWGPDWELQTVFVGHTALITSLLLCPVTGLLLSSSLDGTLRCWGLEVGDQVQVVSVPNGSKPPLAMGGPDSSGTFFSFSLNSVDLWTFNCLYYLHCKLDGALGEPVHQILTPPCPTSFPACVLCIHGNSNVTIVEAETGEVLTRFQAKGRIRCADYCVPMEILLILTEDSVVTVLSTLTNPVTTLDEWHGIEQWDWPGGQVEVNIGKVCCMVLYSNITNTQSALEKWKSLKIQRVHKLKKVKLLHSEKNRFLIVLGHCSGYVSVLNMHSGKVMYRISAHNNQAITSMQAYPDSDYLLTTGEDKTVLVWSLSPFSQPCLSLHLSVCCDLLPLRTALMGTQVIIALQDPENDIHSLLQYSLESQSRHDHQLNEDHHNKITGLCACHRMNVFASSSQDGTIRIWDKENRLLRILELNAEPECLAYCKASGDLLLGITGDLYRIPLTQLLPKKCDSESWIPTKSSECREESCHVAKEDSPKILHDADFGALMARHKDLESLQKGEVECRKRNPATTETKQEAFNNYMRLMYMKPPDIKIPAEDMFDVYAELFPPKLPELCPLTPPSFPEGFFPNHILAKSLHSSNRQNTQASLGYIPNSVLVGQLWPGIMVDHVTLRTNHWRLRYDLERDRGESKPDEVQILFNEEEKGDMHYLTPIIETPPKKENLPPVMKKVKYPVRPPKSFPPSPVPPSPTLAPPSPPTPSPPKQPTPLPPSPPSTRLPEFLLQFVDEQWFQGMFPDLSCISSSLNGKDFCLHLLDFVIRCSMAYRQSILNALILLLQQEVLSKESLTEGLLGCLQNCIHTNMSREEQHFVGELLNLMVYVSPDSLDTIVELLAILADKKVDLQGLVLCVLKRLGVEDAEMWLCPELQHWNTLTKHEPNQHQSLQEMATHWLSTWTKKYKVHSGSVLLQGIKSVITPIEVLQYFCSVQRSKQIRPPPPPPEGRKDTVLVESGLPRLKHIQRLGEMYSMSRIRKPQGCLLPSLSYRPELMGFTRFLSLPTAYVTLSPFPLCLDYRYSKKPSPQKYFFLKRSYVQYYR